MDYREPGVYTKIVSQGTVSRSTVSSRIPLIIGRASEATTHYKRLTRGTGAADSTGLTGVLIDDIVSVGFTNGSSEFVVGNSDDVVASLEGSAPEVLTLTWTESGQSKISAGMEYTLTYKVDSDSDDEQLHKISSESEIISLYGSYTGGYDDSPDGDISINSVALGAYLALLNGAPEVYTLAVVQRDGENLSEAYSRVLNEKVSFIPDVRRIVPMDMTDADFRNIHLAVDSHVRQNSSYEERKERVAIYGYTESDPPTEYQSETGFYSNLKAYIKSKNYERIEIIYPYEFMVTVPGVGPLRVGPQYVAAAIAGLEFAKPVGAPKTRSSLLGISQVVGTKDLDGPRLTRRQMNELAGNGCTIIVQDNISSLPYIRHHLTTDMSSQQSQEPSVVQIKDEVTQRIRNTCEKYVGRFTISSDLIARVRGSINSDLATMEAQGFIIAGEILDIAQSEENKAAIIVSLRIEVAYPCNEIEITIYAE